MHCCRSHVIKSAFIRTLLLNIFIVKLRYEARKEYTHPAPTYEYKHLQCQRGAAKFSLSATKKEHFSAVLSLMLFLFPRNALELKTDQINRLWHRR